jgi:hypothetical protein
VKQQGAATSLPGGHGGPATPMGFVRVVLEQEDEEVQADPTSQRHPLLPPLLFARVCYIAVHGEGAEEEQSLVLLLPSTVHPRPVRHNV